VRGLFECRLEIVGHFFESIGDVLCRVVAVNGVRRFIGHVPDRPDDGLDGELEFFIRRETVEFVPQIVEFIFFGSSPE
jgi:hypothetical protein